MPNESAETLGKVVDATLQNSVSVSVDIFHGGLIERILQKWGVRPKQRVFEIKPITLGNLMRISKILLCIDNNIFKDKNLLDAIYRSMDKHVDDVVHVVGIAIANSKAGPSNALLNLIRHEFTPQDLRTVLSVVLNQMDVANFMLSITSIRGLNVLESEPRKEQEIVVSP